MADDVTAVMDHCANKRYIEMRCWSKSFNGRAYGET
jgi:hypothetical protein